MLSNSFGFQLASFNNNPTLKEFYIAVFSFGMGNYVTGKRTAAPNNIQDKTICKSEIKFEDLPEVYRLNVECM